MNRIIVARVARLLGTAVVGAVATSMLVLPAHADEQSDIEEMLLGTTLSVTGTAQSDGFASNGFASNGFASNGFASNGFSIDFRSNGF